MADDSPVKSSSDELIAAVEAVPDGENLKERVRETIRNHFRTHHPDHPSTPDGPKPRPEHPATHHRHK